MKITVKYLSMRFSPLCTAYVLLRRDYYTENNQLIFLRERWETQQAGNCEEKLLEGLRVTQAKIQITIQELKVGIYIYILYI